MTGFFFGEMTAELVVSGFGAIGFFVKGLMEILLSKVLAVTFGVKVFISVVINLMFDAITFFC